MISSISLSFNVERHLPDDGLDKAQEEKEAIKRRLMRVVNACINNSETKLTS
jgi:hypothetical protein